MQGNDRHSQIADYLRQLADMIETETVSSAGVSMSMKYMNGAQWMPDATPEKILIGQSITIDVGISQFKKDAVTSAV